jgi:phytoene dehydrogenase-like protein
VTMARFGLRALWPSTTFARRMFSTEQARGAFAGVAAHAILPLSAPATASVGIVFCASAHARGWPAARGGSQRIADALTSLVRSHGGDVVTGQRVATMADVPPASAVLFDTSPRAMADIAGDRLPSRYVRRLRRYRHGPGSFKIDYALDGPVPWKADECRRAGTVHLGGTLDEVAASELAVHQGRHPERPYVLVAQQSLFDETRAPEGKHTLWAYCHVPPGSTVDMTDAIEDQIERFAPGFRDLVLARHVMFPADLESHNANYIGGDIAGGSSGGLQILFRPTVSSDPYATPTDGLYLCSASTPPGGGVHGMCGYWAAQSALKRTFGLAP